MSSNLTDRLTEETAIVFPSGVYRSAPIRLPLGNVWLGPFEGILGKWSQGHAERLLGDYKGKLALHA